LPFRISCIQTSLGLQNFTTTPPEFLDSLFPEKQAREILLRSKGEPNLGVFCQNLQAPIIRNLCTFHENIQTPTNNIDKNSDKTDNNNKHDKTNIQQRQDGQTRQDQHTTTTRRTNKQANKCRSASVCPMENVRM
jgi:predicted transcriptional regulator YheO